MPLIKCSLLLVIACFSVSSFANTHLYQHVQAVGQTMSALYMQGLSEGNQKYERDLAFYKQKANESLAQYANSDPESAKALQVAWNALKGDIKATFSREYGWDVDASIRRNFRSYLSKTYQLSLKKSASLSTPSEKYEFSLVQLEAVIARFFDISSAYNGTVSLSSSDLEMLDPKTISKQFKANLDTLTEESQLALTKRDLKAAKYNWTFIEESVVNYSDQSAYFLVYATKNKISKVLSSGHATALGNH